MNNTHHNITIIVADITTLHVDAIVNAAIPDKDKKKDKEKKSREQQVDDYVEEPSEE